MKFWASVSYMQDVDVDDDAVKKAEAFIPGL